MAVAPPIPDQAFEREKWEAECRFRDREIAIREIEASFKTRDFDLRSRELDVKIEEQRRSRFSSPLVLAIAAAAIGALSNAGVAWLNGSSQRNSELLRAEAARVLEAIKATPEQATKNLAFFADAGLIKDDLLAGVKAYLATLKPGQGPSLSPQPSVITNPPNYSVPVPQKSTLQTNAATSLLAVAVGELNRNVSETASSDRINEYIRAAGIFSDRPSQIPWSGAFLAWALRESGSGDKLVRSGAIMPVWNDAVAKSWTFLPREKQVLAGDIVIFQRTTGPDVAIEALRSGKIGFAPAAAGIVYSADQENFLSIEANSNNAIHLRPHKINEKIVGFIRLGDMP